MMRYFHDASTAALERRTGTSHAASVATNAIRTASSAESASMRQTPSSGIDPPLVTRIATAIAAIAESGIVSTFTHAAVERDTNGSAPAAAGTSGGPIRPSKRTKFTLVCPSRLEAAALVQ